MTDNEKLRYEYFIETGTVWIDTNDSIELDYLKWLEAKINYTPCCESDSELLKSVDKLGYTAWKNKLGLIKDYNKGLYKLNGNYITVNEVLDMYEVYCDTF